MRTYEAILSEQPFFRDFNSEQIRFIAACATEVCFEAGDFIFHQGGEADRFFLIREGRVALEIFTPQRGVITFQTIGEGDVLGASWLFPPYLWHFEAQALEYTYAFAFSAECMRLVLEEDQKLGYELMKRFAHVMMQRLQATRFQLLDVYANPIEGHFRG